MDQHGLKPGLKRFVARRRVGPQSNGSLPRHRLLEVLTTEGRAPLHRGSIAPGLAAPAQRASLSGWRCRRKIWRMSTSGSACGSRWTIPTCGPCAQVHVSPIRPRHCASWLSVRLIARVGSGKILQGGVSSAAHAHPQGRTRSGGAHTLRQGRLRPEEIRHSQLGGSARHGPPARDGGSGGADGPARMDHAA